MEGKAVEEMEQEKRKPRREEEILETALAAAGAALFVSGLKKLLPCILKQWPVALVVTPSPLLFLLLNLIIASIVVISVQPKCGVGSKRRSPTDGLKKKKSRQRGKRSSSPASTMEKKEMEFVELGGDKGGEDGDAEELNARVEAFITAFKRQLRIDSFSSAAINRTKYAGTPTPSCSVDHQCFLESNFSCR